MSKNALYVVIADLQKKVVVLELVQYVENLVSHGNVDFLEKFVSLGIVDFPEKFV